MKWDVFYDRFWDWAESTQIRNLSKLEDFGPSEEITEVALEYDQSHGTRLIRKALEAGGKFRPEDIVTLIEEVLPEELYGPVFRANSAPYSWDELEELEDIVDPQLLEEAGEPCTGPSDWDDFYNAFDEWDEETQSRNLAELKNYGPSDEVTDVAEELWDEDDVDRLVGGAIRSGVKFSPEEILRLISSVSPQMQETLIRAAGEPFTQSQLDELADLFWDLDLMEEIARRDGLTCSWEEDGLDEEALEALMTTLEPKPKGLLARLTGWMTRHPILAAMLAGFAGPQAQKQDKEHDCVNGPAHYGYRYGRWYYGHCHQYGCEFGKSKGDGSKD